MCTNFRSTVYLSPRPDSRADDLDARASARYLTSVLCLSLSPPHSAVPNVKIKSGSSMNIGVNIANQSKGIGV